MSFRLKHSMQFPALWRVTKYILLDVNVWCLEIRGILEKKLIPHLCTFSKTGRQS